MGTICLSPAPNLRCVGLSLTQEVVTLVPVALEVIFSLGLALTGRDAGRCVYGSLGICQISNSFLRPASVSSSSQRAQSIFC
jgi:hypothetical protein